ncbi:MAG TPA: outer membrane beta-barrel protein [Flavobacteriales bacterium]
MRIPLLLLLTGLSLLTHAQNEFRHGPRLGLSMATRTAGNALLSWTGLPKFGPIYGWSFDAPITEQIHVLVEPTMMTKGSWTRNSQFNENTYITVRYLELPALLKLSTNPDPQGLFLSGGVIFGYAMGGKFKNVRDGQVTQEFKYNFEGTNNRSQWNIALGLGSEKKNWMYELRIQQSVTPLSPLVRGQDLVVGLHLTYRLPLPKTAQADREAEEQERLEKEQREERKQIRKEEREERKLLKEEQRSE